jgi:subtilisin family serine protease
LDGERPPEDLYFYRPGEILVSSDPEQIRLFEEVADKIGLRYTRGGWNSSPGSDAERGDEVPDPRAVAWDPPAGGAVPFYVQSRSDIETVLRRLERASGKRLTVSPNHVLFGCPVWGGSPDGDPSLPRPGENPVVPGPDVAATGVVVAVVDSGVPHGYEDNDLLDAVESLPIDLEPWAYSGPSPVLVYPQGHGSFVSGMVRQAAPGATVMSFRALDTDGVSDEWYLGYQISLALAADPQVLNLSLGGLTRNDERLMGLGGLAAQVAETGSPVVVAAAGNWGDSRPVYPAADNWTIGVGAVELTGEDPVPVPAVFSDYGPWVDACADGVQVVSAYEAKPYRPTSDPTAIINFEGVACWSGTSFATPHVAGVAANLLATQPGLDRDGVIAELAELSGVAVDGLGWFVP